jgi:hypothetical protein
MSALSQPMGSTAASAMTNAPRDFFHGNRKARGVATRRLLGPKKSTKYTGAEPLLLTGCEGMKQREKMIRRPDQVRIP